LLDIAEHAVLPLELEPHVTEVIRHHATNYTGYAREMLSAAARSTNARIARLGSEILRYLEAEILPPSEPLPRELHPSPSRSAEYYRLSTRKHSAQARQAMDADPGRSPLMHIVKRVTIGRGNGWFFKVQGQFNAPSRFTKFSQQMEVPRLELLDPDGEAYRRVVLSLENKRLREQRSSEL
jgi:hypothetical protein